MYVELLVIENLFMNYLIINTTGVILNRISNFKRMFLASVIGCIPLVFIYKDISIMWDLIINLLFAIFMTIISFGYRDILYLVKNVIYVYFVSIFIAGGMYLIDIHFLNVASGTISIIILLISAPIISKIYINNLKKIKNINSNYYKVDIYFKDDTKKTLIGYVDTGNMLVDPYMRKPIVLVNKKLIKNTDDGFVLVPYNTIDSHGLLRCLRPQKIFIYNVGIKRNVLIGLVDNVGIEGVDCILSQKLLERNRDDKKTAVKNN